MLLQNYRNKVRVDLSDLAKVYITNDMLDRALDRAVSDLSRFLPLSKVLEVTFDITVTDEAWTSGAAAGTYVALANKPIKYQTEVVKNNAGATMTRDTDYTIKYHEGKITHISGKGIGDAEGCTISYTKSQLVIDLTEIADELIRVDRVEYPYGSVPQEHQSYALVGNYLVLVGEGISAQEEVTDKSHALIEYKAKHTPPTTILDGTYPLFLDDTIVLASDAYTLFSLAMLHEHQAVAYLTEAKTSYLDSIAAIHGFIATALGRVTTYSAAAILEINGSDDPPGSMHTEFALATTALGSMGTEVGAAATALGKVTTYCETNADGNAKGIMESIKTDVLKLKTAIQDSLANASGYIDDAVGETSDLSKADLVWTDLVKHLLTADPLLPNAQTYLENGEDFINALARVYGVTTLQATIETALDALTSEVLKSSEYIAHATNDDAIGYIAKAEGTTPNGVVAIEAALDAMTALLTIPGQTTSHVHHFIKTGEPLINNVNEGGKQAPVLYKEYAEAAMAIVNALREEANTRINQSGLYLKMAELYQTFSSASASVSSAYSLEASSRLEYFKDILQQAGLHREYATSALDMCAVWAGKRDALITQAGRRNDAALAEMYIAAQRIAHLKSYIEESQGWNSIALTFIAEAETRVKTGQHFGLQSQHHIEMAGAHSTASQTYARLAEAAVAEANSWIYEIDRYMGQTDRLLSLAAGRRETADRLRQDAIERRNEAWTIWRDPNQFIGEQRAFSTSQPS